MLVFVRKKQNFFNIYKESYHNLHPLECYSYDPTCKYRSLSCFPQFHLAAYLQDCMCSTNYSLKI